MPLGICGTARLIAEYSWRSGSSSAKYIGIAFEGSRALALNESFVDIAFFFFFLFVDTKNSKLFLYYVLCIFRPLNGLAETENDEIFGLNHFYNSFTTPLSHN